MTNETTQTQNDEFYYNIPVELTLQDYHEAIRFLITKVKFVQKYLIKQIIKFLLLIFCTIIFVSVLYLMHSFAKYKLNADIDTFYLIFISIPIEYIILAILVFLIDILVIPLVCYLDVGKIKFKKILYDKTKKTVLNSLINKSNINFELILTSEFINEKYPEKDETFLWSEIKDIYLSKNLFIILLKPNESLLIDMFLENIKFILIPKRTFNSNIELEEVYNSSLKYLKE